MNDSMKDVNRMFAVQVSAYYEGIKEGIALFAWTKDDVAYVGTNGTLLKDAIARVEQQKADRLEQMLAHPR